MSLAGERRRPALPPPPAPCSSAFAERDRRSQRKVTDARQREVTASLCSPGALEAALARVHGVPLIGLAVMGEWLGVRACPRGDSDQRRSTGAYWLPPIGTVRARSTHMGRLDGRRLNCPRSGPLWCPWMLSSWGPSSGPCLCRSSCGRVALAAQASRLARGEDVETWRSVTAAREDFGV